MLLKLEVAAMCKLHQAKIAAKEFFADEQGDTNFISVIIILCIVAALAIIFRENIAKVANDVWDQVMKNSNAATGANSSATHFQ